MSEISNIEENTCVAVRGDWPEMCYLSDSVLIFWGWLP